MGPASQLGGGTRLLMAAILTRVMKEVRKQDRTGQDRTGQDRTGQDSHLGPVGVFYAEFCVDAQHVLNQWVTSGAGEQANCKEC